MRETHTIVIVEKEVIKSEESLEVVEAERGRRNIDEILVYDVLKI